MKKWIALILGVVMVLGVTACGDGQNGNGGTPSRNESQSNETKTLGMEESSQQGSESNSETIVEVQEEGAETSTEMPEISGGGKDAGGLLFSFCEYKGGCRLYCLCNGGGFVRARTHRNLHGSRP